jgi:hypothetical protein
LRALAMMVFPLVFVIAVGLFSSYYTTCTTTSVCTFDVVSFLLDNPLGYLLTGNISGFIQSFKLTVNFEDVGQTPTSCAPDDYYCIAYSSHTSTLTMQSVILTLLGFIAGFVLIILSLGITVSGQAATVGASFGSSGQGAKQMLAFGIGLVIYSWFSGWSVFLTATIPEGIGTIIWVILTIIYCLGMYEAGRTYL